MNLRSLLLAAVAGAALGAAASALAANSGQMLSPPAQPQGVVSQGVDTPALVYRNFGAMTCDATAFSSAAVGDDNANGTIDIAGRTTLNGAAYDTFSFSLGPGPMIGFGTGFGRTFSPALGSSTYTFIFYSAVSQTGNFLGTSVTTFQCTAGVLTATNAWVPASGVPTLSQWALIALGVAVLVIGVVMLRRRMRTT